MLNKLDRKKITKLLLQDNLPVFEAVPISMNTQATPPDVYKRGDPNNQKIPAQETELLLRIYDDSSFKEAAKLFDNFSGRFAIVRLPDEV